jgi:MFS family permease
MLGVSSIFFIDYTSRYELVCQLGCGGIFSATPAVVAHWFQKRRGLAMGLVATGSSLGGTVFPIAVKYLLPRVGYVIFTV